MRVLVVHNRYRTALPSGENVVVDDEIRELRRAGLSVDTYIRSSDEIASMSPLRRASVATGPVWAPGAVRDVRVTLRTARPDVLHLHNPYPLISPMVIRAARKAGVPVVQTVHNHRHVCAKATYFRDGRVCTDCLGKPFPWPSVAHGCYRDSRAQSLPMAATLSLHRGTWGLVHRFLVLTEDLVKDLTSIGVPAERIVVRPNTVPDAGTRPEAAREGFLFVGRLGEEKGVELLIDAWRRHPVGSLGSLTFVGEGPKRTLVEQLMAERPDVQWLGQQDHTAVVERMRTSTALVVPSTCPEAFPRVVVEALSVGLPVIATRLGGLPYIVTPEVGWICNPDPGAVAEALKEAATARGQHVRAARARYLSLYHPDRVLAQLLDVYDSVTKSATHDDS